MSRTACITMVFGALCLLAACGPREHMGADYGRAYRNNFTRQVIWPPVGGNPPRGLDSEEAALIHESYRQQLGAQPQKGASESQRVLILEEPQGAKKPR